MNPTAAAALRWGGAVVGLLLVVWFTVPALLNAMANSVQFGDEDEASVLLEGGDAEEPADGAEPADDAEPADNGEPADDEGEPDDENGDDDGNDDDDGDGGDGNGDDGNGDDGGGDGDGGGTATAAGGQYEVQAGDTLFSIAEQVLGDGHRWTEIAELNGLADGRDLRVGQVLDMPAD